MGRCVHSLSKLGKLKWAWSVFSGDTKRGACNDRAYYMQIGCPWVVE